MVFIDDILVYSLDWSTHMEHLKLVFAALREHKFYLSRSVCLANKSWHTWDILSLSEVWPLIHRRQ
jgi:hypothetical protein